MKTDVVNWYEIIAGSLISTSSVVVVALFVARESFKKLLDKELAHFQHDKEFARFQHELSLDAKT